jgi:hypothetical protein
VSTAMPPAVLQDVEWGGDVVSGVVLVAFGVALVAFGYAWGRWRALAVLAAVWTIPLAAADLLYFGLDVNLLGYCGEPDCDPGPIPMTVLLLFLPVGLTLAGGGVAARRRRSR